ncbi:hypothetical protein LOAG_14442 [Loa loa]|uniref:Uncharacterized protein n=1 Tax=Loa loa TaxID=7209 RepID=A0A1S0THR1_LOALO|nr:hypothetical protein LOAG_14442 [Loa loa]EFO14081.1 hypothetical protein LOAG_14442 [Loa loa]
MRVRDTVNATHVYMMYVRYAIDVTYVHRLRDVVLAMRVAQHVCDARVRKACALSTCGVLIHDTHAHDGVLAVCLCDVSVLDVRLCQILCCACVRRVHVC